MASQSRNNVRRRGSTWTYYVYVTDGAGHRKQISKGGFRTRRRLRLPGSRRSRRSSRGRSCNPSD